MSRKHQQIVVLAASISNVLPYVSLGKSHFSSFSLSSGKLSTDFALSVTDKLPKNKTSFKKLFTLTLMLFWAI